MPRCHTSEKHFFFGECSVFKATEEQEHSTVLTHTPPSAARHCGSLPRRGCQRCEKIDSSAEENIFSPVKNTSKLICSTRTVWRHCSMQSEAWKMIPVLCWLQCLSTGSALCSASCSSQRAQGREMKRMTPVVRLKTFEIVLGQIQRNFW